MKGQPKASKYTVGVLNATMEDFLKVDERYHDWHPFRDGNQIIFSNLTQNQAGLLEQRLIRGGYTVKVLEGIMKEDTLFKYRNR